jgi:hypothetical protein
MRLHARSTLAALATVASVSACQDSSTGPTGPTSDLTVTLLSVVAIEPCEEFLTDLDGGEFVFRFTVTWPDNSEEVVAQTTGYPDVTKFFTLRRNEPFTSGLSAGHTSAGDGAIRITFNASEVDFDAFGNNPGPDSRMNNASREEQHSWNGSAWPSGLFSAELNPTSGCSLGAAYRITATER